MARNRLTRSSNWIKEQKAASAGIQVDALGRAIWQTTGSIKAAADEYAALSHGLVALDSALVQLRSRFAAEEEDLRKVAEIWETYKSSASPEAEDSLVACVLRLIAISRMISSPASRRG